jgi:tagatose-6-phosphate ketose/aldose isomerase
MTVNAPPPGRLSQLAARSIADQQAAGYVHTLAEVLQQPQTWRETAARVDAEAGFFAAQRHSVDAIALTGSGSSFYLCECLAPVLQATLRIPVVAVPAGNLLTHSKGLLPPGRTLLVSFARSGDSPESAAVIDTLLATAPECRHLFVTCNPEGRLATDYDGRADVWLLDPRTNDRSLVMTSSFTNLFLGGLALAGAPLSTRALQAADAAERVIATAADALARFAEAGFDSILYLGSGARVGSAHESALKLLEMTGGHVQTLSETYLGLRHGPMSALRPETRVVAFLSADPAVRGYEDDLLRELTRKGLGTQRVLVGPDASRSRLDDADIAIDNALDDTVAPLTDVLVGQLLGLFRCLALGFQPDAPSQGVLTRVVESFAIHGATRQGDTSRP